MSGGAQWLSGGKVTEHTELDVDKFFCTLVEYTGKSGIQEMQNLPMRLNVYYHIILMDTNGLCSGSILLVNEVTNLQ